MKDLAMPYEDLFVLWNVDTDTNASLNYAMIPMNPK